MSEQSQKRQRRWFQLSLKSLFLLTLVVAAYFAGYRMAMRKAQLAQEAEHTARQEAEIALREAQRAEDLLRMEAERARLIAAVQYLQAVASQNQQAMASSPPVERTEPLEK